MKNMGLSRLRLAAPAFAAERRPGPGGVPAPGGKDPGRVEGCEGVIRARAIHAADLWERAETFDSLADALGDCSLVLGVTRRRGHRRKSVSLSPAEAAGFLAARPGTGALVFGNERTGLEDAELELCNMASHIPASGEFPSLNLSHAVQIYAYELFLALESGRAGPVSGGLSRQGAAGEASAGRAAGPDPVKGEWRPLSRARIDELTASITDTLADLGFYRHPGREMQERFLRDLIARAGLSEREGKYLADIFARAARLGAR
jgi:tRNA/rRNA methyltransferase/tRNA (cytidine32/uridine32-2'-O)-methyltransferase